MDKGGMNEFLETLDPDYYLDLGIFERFPQRLQL